MIPGYHVLPGLDGCCSPAQSWLADARAVPDGGTRWKVKGWELGADDYLVKPFSFAELLAVHGHPLRRGRGGTETNTPMADLEADLLRQTGLMGGRRIDLTAKEV